MDKLTFCGNNIKRVNYIRDISTYELKELKIIFIENNLLHNENGIIFILNNVKLMYDVLFSLSKEGLYYKCLLKFGLMYDKYLLSKLNTMLTLTDIQIGYISCIIHFFKWTYPLQFFVKRFNFSKWFYETYERYSVKDNKELYILIHVDLVYILNERICDSNLKKLYDCLIFYKSKTTWKEKMIVLSRIYYNK